MEQTESKPLIHEGLLIDIFNIINIPTLNISIGEGVIVSHTIIINDNTYHYDSIRKRDADLATLYGSEYIQAKLKK